MITVYTRTSRTLSRGGTEVLTDDAVWIDLLSPTPDEVQATSALLGGDIPTRDEMEEIEASSRLSRVAGMATMITPVLANSTGFNPENVSLAFVLTADRLVTVRYGTPQAVTAFADWLNHSHAEIQPGDILLQLLEALVDRMADVLERITHDLDAISHRIFHQPTSPDRARRRVMSRDLESTLRTIGRGGDLQSKARDTVMGLKRIVAFLPMEESLLSARDVRTRIKTISRDLQSLSEYVDFQANKVAFLLDASLGMINIQQNKIIKLFSVMAVLLMPPTLVASIYGMNFHHMPELDQPWGYPMALLLMLLAAVVPYWLFKRRGWM